MKKDIPFFTYFELRHMISIERTTEVVMSRYIMALIKGGYGMEFSIKDIIALFMKKIVLIAVCTFAGLSILFVLSQFVMKPSYTASVQLYVNQNDVATSADLNDLYYAQKVVTTYINFLQTKVFYEQVLMESQLNYSPNQLKNMTEINSVNNTEIFKISVTTYSAKASYKIVSAMQNIAPVLIKSIKPSAQISVVDPVTFPTLPSGPNILLDTAAGGLAGLILSLAIIFLCEVIDVNVKNQEELKRKYNRPILGEIPSYDTHIKKSHLFRGILFKKHRIPRRSNVIIADDDNFMMKESYKALRSNLRYTLYKDGCRKILINSPVSKDGKSTVCANTGITIAQTGARVLLLDCDLRRGRLHNFFNLKSSPGISEILSGLAKEKDAIQNTSYDNLQVIAMGAIPPNPTELLAGGQMEELIKSLEKNYDFIILDSPPINVVSDVLSLLKLVDGVVVVVRENITSHPNIANALSKYEFVEAKILGFVLNGISLRRGNKSKYQYYSYQTKK